MPLPSLSKTKDEGHNGYCGFAAPVNSAKDRWAANSLEWLHIVGMLFVMRTIARGRAAPQCCDTLSRELSVITGVFVGCTMIDLIHTRRIIRPLEKTCLFAVLCRKGGELAAGLDKMFW